MVARRYIDRDIPVLKSSDTVSFAQEMMADYKTSQLPVVDDQQYKGILNEELADFDLLPADTKVASLELQHQKVFIPENYHFYEIARIASENLLKIIAVADKDHHYMGVVNVAKATLSFANKFADHPVGGVFVLSMNAIDYSLTEISRLVESNEAKILSCFVETDQVDPNKLLVTLKVNTIDLTRIIATFERFEYNVTAKFHDKETRDYDSYRIDLLLKFLEI